MPVKIQSIRFYSPLPVEECAARLQVVTKPGIGVVHFLRTLEYLSPVIGTVDGTKFRLWKRRRRRGMLKVVMDATMEPLDGGTLIVGRVEIPEISRWVYRILIGVAFAYVSVVIVYAIAASFGLAAYTNEVKGLLGRGFAAFLFVPVVLLATFSSTRSLSEYQVRFLIEFLTKTIGVRFLEPAREAVPSGAGTPGDIDCQPV